MPFPIQKMHKAHYLLMNIECNNETLEELEHSFKFNDAILRHMILKMTEAVVTPSPMMKEVAKDEARKAATVEAPAAAPVAAPVAA